MIPLTVNPVVIVYVDNGAIKGTATNTAQDLTVIVVDTKESFDEKALGKPFVHTVG